MSKREQALLDAFDATLRELARYRASGVTITDDGTVHIPRRWHPSQRTIALDDDGAVRVWNGPPLLEGIPDIARMEALQTAAAWPSPVEIWDLSIRVFSRDRQSLLLVLTWQTETWVETGGTNETVLRGREHARVRDGIDAVIHRAPGREMVWPELWESVEMPRGRLL